MQRTRRVISERGGTLGRCKVSALGRSIEGVVSITKASAMAGNDGGGWAGSPLTDPGAPPVQNPSRAYLRLQPAWLDNPTAATRTPFPQSPLRAKSMIIIV